MSENIKHYSLIKENIQKLIEQGKIEAAQLILSDYERINAEDEQIYLV